MDALPIPVAIALLLNRGRVFMVRRPRTKPLAGKWEFPGGKVAYGEDPIAAVRRELREELGLRVRRLALFGAYSHVYDFREGPVHYVLFAYRGTAPDGTWARRGRWLDARAVRRVPVLEGSRPIVSDLVSRGLLDGADEPKA